MRHDEENFQIGVVRALRRAGHFVFAVSNGWGKMTPAQAVRAKMQGIMPGVSDLILLLPGKVYFIELKNPNGKGRQSPNQRDFEDNVRAFGQHYIIWDNWAQVEQFINAHRAEIGNYMGVGGTK